MAVLELLLLNLRSFQAQEKKTVDAPRNISFAFWLSCLILFLPGTLVGAQTYVQERCADRGDYASPSKYQDNLNRLLDRGDYAGDNKRPIYGFYNTTEGEDPDRVYGLFLCRGDVAVDLCQSCIRKAGTTLIERCPGQKEATIWYDECLVRYANRSFFSIMETEPIIFVANPVDRSAFINEDLAANVTDLLKNVTDLAISSKSLYASRNFNVSSSVTLHVLVQCTPDISKSACKSCLLSAIKNVSTVLILKRDGARILQPSCNLRYQMNTTNKIRMESGSKGVKRNLWIPIVSSIIGLGLLIIIVGSCIFFKRKRRLKKEKEESQEVQLLQLRQEIGEEFSKENARGEKPMGSQELSLMRLDIIRTATGNFSNECKLGEGGFGSVYRGTLADGKEIAVKRLSRTSGQGLIELKNEVILIARLQHRNLVRLLGCCLEEEEKLLIYEYLPNKSLDIFLFDSIIGRYLNWKMRMNIACGVARGLLYLHEDSRLKIIHRDLKASNILLDGEMNPKISDFGMARIFSVNQDKANTNRVVGTYGYMAPEYAMQGLFSVKSDVFSFGVLLLEIVSGCKNNGFHLQEQGESLLTYAWKLWSEGRPLELIDPLINESYYEAEVLKCIHVGLLCVQEDPADRPIMSLVVHILGGDTITLSQPSQPAFSVGRDAKKLDRTTQEASSVNGITLSVVAAR
ncbi:hypothetical protein BT93_E1644 [Corymbia citriodora subsp. variegata]|nr:hypothetical protein BT93_E1644 [Corymbia citriodora subsp. variegata]